MSPEFAITLAKDKIERVAGHQRELLQGLLKAIEERDAVIDLLDDALGPASDDIIAAAWEEVRKR